MTTQERIEKLEKEILRLKRIEELEEFKEYMNNCYDVLMGDGATDESVNVFYTSDFTITFRGKSISISNGADIYTAIGDIVDFELEELKEFTNI